MEVHDYFPFLISFENSIYSNAGWKELLITASVERDLPRRVKGESINHHYFVEKHIRADLLLQN
jgi:hypothetical protein